MLGLGWGGGLIILFTSHNYALLFGLHGRQDRHGHDYHKSDGRHFVFMVTMIVIAIRTVTCEVQLSQFLRCFDLEPKC